MGYTPSRLPRVTFQPSVNNGLYGAVKGLSPHEVQQIAAKIIASACGVDPAPPPPPRVRHRCAYCGGPLAGDACSNCGAPHTREKPPAPPVPSGGRPVRMAPPKPEPPRNRILKY